MSARESLIAALEYQRTINKVGWTREEAEAAVDAYAHELAEKIRAATGAVNDDKIWYASEAADLVDPEVGGS